MNVIERAKEYAEGKALEAITAAIEKAYADGYNDGLNHLENEKLEAAKSGVTYVDLGLPSGTLWSSGYVLAGPQSFNYKLFGYSDASKLNIPTKEQFEELYKYCKVGTYYEQERSGAKPKGIIFIGVSGKTISIPYTKVMYLNADIGFKNSFYFWIKDDEEGDKKNCAGIINNEQDIIKNEKKEKNVMVAPVNKIFMGLKLPVMLVK